MTLRAPSAYNGHVAMATGQVISFIKDPKKFKLNKYAQYIESPSTVGIYARIDRGQPGRVVNDADFIWADGADRPKGDWNQIRWEWVEFSTLRRNYPFRIGNMAIASAKRGGLDPVSIEAGATSSQAMINRTKRVIAKLETTSNWGSNTGTANDLNGGVGSWVEASSEPGPHYLAIKKSLMGAALNINIRTNGVVQPSDLVLLINPELATDMANTLEIHNYLKYGPFSREQLENNNNANALWGLPPSLYGFELMVEDSVVVTSRPGAADTYDTDGTRAYIKSPNSAVLCSRVGGIEGIYGGKSLSTIQLYWNEWEMAVQAFDDTINERIDGHVVDNFAEILACPESGYLITGVRS